MPSRAATVRGATVAAAVAAFLILSAALFSFTIDDAFITLRYARNLADGMGAVFDAHGRQPEAYSSPLWMIIAAAAFLAGLDDDGVVVFVKVLGVAFGAATVLATAEYTRRWTGSGSAGARAAMLLALMPWLAFWSVSGLETAPYVLLVLLALLALDRHGGRAAVASGGLLALLALTRPEGIAVAGGMLVGAVAARRRPWNAATVVAVVYATYLAWHLSYFGSLLPATAAAKSGSFGIAHLSSRLAELLPLAAYLLPFVALYGLGTRSGTRMPLPAAGAAVACAAFAIVPRLEGAPGFRYELALLPLVASAAASGWWRYDAAAPSWKRALAAAGILMLALVPLVTLWHPARFSPAALEITFARWLRQHAPAASIGVYDLGAVPYYSAAPTVIDTNPAGPLSPFAGRRYDVDAVLADLPSFLVLPPPEEAQADDPLSAVYGRPAFQRDYDELFRLSLTSEYRVVIWKHRAVALPDSALDAAASAGLLRRPAPSASGGR